MHFLWQTLLANLAIIALFILAVTHTGTWLESLTSKQRGLAFGILMGCGSVTQMLFPFEIQGGIYIDLRSSLIGVAGFFGGPLAGITAALMAGSYRAIEGGIGIWAGLISIALSAFIGAAGHMMLRGRTPSRGDVVAVGAAIGTGTILTLYALPYELWSTLIPVLALPLASLLFCSTVFAGLAIDQENRRRMVLAENGLYRAVIEALPDCLNAKDLEGRFLIANPATAVLMQASSRDALIGKTDFDFYQYQTALEFRANEALVVADAQPATFEQKVVYADGSQGWLSILKAPLRDQSGQITGVITHNRDITDRRLLEDELSESRWRLSEALASMDNALVMFDRTGHMVLCNTQYQALFPKTADIRVPGIHYREMLRISAERGEPAGVSAADAENWINTIGKTAGNRGNEQFELADGRWIEASTRPTPNDGWLVIFADITRLKRDELALVETNARLEALARMDGLTGLANRREFDEVLKREFGRSSRANAPISLLLIDVDQFKSFNDTYGHPAGDACLKAVAGTLRLVLKRSTDTPARYGGEEFAVILCNTDTEGALHLAEMLRAAIRDLRVVHAAQGDGFVSVSIGVATYEPGITIMRAIDLIDHADEALYLAKNAGRNQVQVWGADAARKGLRSIA